ncbi:MAG TPA: hypothetical protein VHQ44_06380 [Thermoanaerobaculia bacterium]|nr:hypothetical protein [Thermoanaerobaculia bacterium]
MKRAYASAAFAVLLALPASAAGVEKTQGVYVTFLSGLKADVGETSAKAESALKGAGFTVLASFDNGVPQGCQAKARTIVFASEPWAAEVLSGGADKAFGLPMRLAVYGDASGASVALVNPVSLLRTFYASDAKDAAAQKAVEDIAAALAPLGMVSPKQAGQLRDSGEIGGMGGGAFPNKIIPVLAPAKPPAEVAEALKAGIADAGGWHAVYAYKASDDVFVVGLTNAKTEGRAFGIAGEKRATEANPFPGIDHAAAFPIEVVVAKKGAGSSVTLLKEMWRMKLYFQDAGNWAFMKNMQMPGDIQNEIEAAVRKAVR